MTAETQDDPRFDRLPVWAKERITDLERKLHGKTVRLEQLTDNPASSLWHVDYSDLTDNRIYLSEHDKIVFELIRGDKQSEVSFYLTQDHSSMAPYIRCDAGWGQLIAEAGGGANCLKLYPRRVLEGWLTNSH